MVKVSWFRLTLLAGGITGIHYLAKSYLAKDEEDEKSSFLLSPTLAVAPILTVSGVYLVYKQSHHVLGLGSCGILTYLALDFCRKRDQNTIAYKGGKIVCGVAGLGAMLYSSRVVCDFYCFTLVNSIALTPVISKYVKQFFKAVGNRVDQGVESLSVDNPDGNLFTKNQDVLSQAANIIQNVVANGENNEDVLSQAANILQNVPQLVKKYQSQIELLSVAIQNPDKLEALVQNPDFISNLIQNPEQLELIANMFGGQEAITDLIKQVQQQMQQQVQVQQM